MLFACTAHFARTRTRKVTSIDTSAAEKTPGRDRGARDRAAGHGNPVGEAGDRGRRGHHRRSRHATPRARSRCEYEVLPHLVQRRRPRARPARAPKRPASRSPAIPTRRFRKPTSRSEGSYGIPVITHCCLEPHGQAIEWKGDSGQLSGPPRRTSPASAAIWRTSIKMPASQHPRPHGLRRRRVRQQVRRRPLGPGVRAALAKPAAASRSSCFWTAPPS